MAKEFRGRIKDGKLKLRDMEGFKKAQKELEGEQIYLKIDKWFKKRSDRQNRYYHGVVVRILAEETGHSHKEIHGYLKDKFIKKRHVLGENVAAISTTDLSTKEFEEYLRKIRMWASRDLETFIPAPNQAPWGFAYDNRETD